MATAVGASGPGTSQENGSSPTPVPPADGPSEEYDPANRERIQRVLSSDIGITTLLNRLKQSISSTRDFAAFLKERSIIEEKHAQGLKRLSRTTHDVIRRPENRQGSFAQNYEEITKTHDRMADHGIQYANMLYAMSEELHELSANSERGRKHWKQTGLNAEKRVQDAEAAMEKAKYKYNSLAEQYDRARTGERLSGKFGLKGPKSAAQYEEDLSRKLEVADSDYTSKAQVAQTQQQELLTAYRPQTVHALQELIKETDAGLSLQVQKFAALSEKLLLGYGLSITPLKSQSPASGPSPKSLREIASSINNDRDFVEYVLSFSNNAGTRADEIQYEQHPSSSPKQQPLSRPPQPYDSGPSDPYAQDYGPNQGPQMSAVNPYPGEEYRAPSSQPQYPTGNQGQAPNYGPSKQQPPPSHQKDYGSGAPQRPSQTGGASGAPQLPQIGSFEGDQIVGQTASIVSPIGPAAPRPQNVAASQPQNAAVPRPQNAPAPQPQNAAARPQNTAPFQPQNAAPRPPQMGMGQGPGTPGEPRPAGTGPPQASQGPGPQPGMPLQGPGPRMGGPGPQGELRSTGTGPPQAGQGSGSQQGRPPQGPGPRMGGPGPMQGPPHGPQSGAPHPQHPGHGGSVSSIPGRGPGVQRPGPPVRPVFGVSLDDLFQREGSAVPIIVLQCINAVDSYGLDVEGIYRTSGSAHHIMELRQQFDHDASAVDFRNTAAFFNDIASVTTLLKHFLRDLPDPLLTSAQYQDFIQAAKLDEESVRRDSIHALVNALPDPNYATLRALALHLHRVAQHSDKNKMTNSNLAIVFAPTLMGQHASTNGHSGGGGVDIADAGWQAKVVETIFNNTFQIFDEDE
ncbi:uncharacterized protein Z518_04179 [Rhinocladiella mackenziei CBS 650.93]|uniref:RhoGAP-domain-containing protein n=1 Tax=Rhinocladiella mackenziei CBS 650.93 TaxID=1442369 RepID=A0A0D2IKG5_9EURO|nr:uncharacterized protein Z518_04179 [Rhinocladiella mackenziei CBS 650.93]KIX06204.1 hypothetical protein Z518_04179 [Rhinocladiella mackenziei CBS 650.93]